MSLEEYQGRDKDRNIEPLLCLSSVLVRMRVQDVDQQGSVTKRSTRGAIVILTSHVPKGSYAGFGNIIPANDHVKDLVQTAGKLGILAKNMICLPRNLQHSRTLERELESTRLRFPMSITQI